MREKRCQSRVAGNEPVARRVEAASFTEARSCTSCHACFGFWWRGLRVLDAPAACVTPRAWSTEVGPGPPRLRVNKSERWESQKARRE